MFRLRRYRGFVVFALISVALLYHFVALSDIPDGSSMMGDGGHTGTYDSGSQGRANENSRPQGSGSRLPKLADSAPSRDKQEVLSSVDGGSTQDDSDVTSPSNKPAAVEYVKSEEQGFVPAVELPDDENAKVPRIHWQDLPEHFPVPAGDIIALPKGKPKKIPQIQSKFGYGRGRKVEAKLKAIRNEFRFSWNGYKTKAWRRDELKPKSGDYKDKFNGWGATLVDSLDSLWLMGLTEDFEEAVRAVAQIDFTTSLRNDIPVFETVIRYLGGLIAAYDISKQEYQDLLTKAVELADVLMGAFDTPNRMPLTYYHWKPTFASQPHRAGTRVVLAELASLSLEFTRLAQLTGSNKYYDAIARITNALEIYQSKTFLPGLWPQMLDASGCTKTSSGASQSQIEWTEQKKGTSGDSEEAPVASSPWHNPDGKKNVGKVLEEAKSAPPPERAAPASGGEAAAAPPAHAGSLRKRQEAEAAGSEEKRAEAPVLTSKENPSKGNEVTDDDNDVPGPADTLDPHCEPQGIANTPYSTADTFGVGGLVDSAYEYLPKMHLLTGGLVPQYQSMYEKAADAMNKHLLFRPMIPDEKRPIMAMGLLKHGSNSKDPNANYKDSNFIAEGSHLTCFVGAMYAIGSRIFNRDEDLDIAKKLTDGCVWAYEATETGIMPETFHMLPCDDMKKCKWDETRWAEAAKGQLGDLGMPMLEKGGPDYPDVSTHVAEDGAALQQQLAPKSDVVNSGPPSQPGSVVDVAVPGGAINGKGAPAKKLEEGVSVIDSPAGGNKKPDEAGTNADSDSKTPAESKRRLTRRQMGDFEPPKAAGVPGSKVVPVDDDVAAANKVRDNETPSQHLQRQGIPKGVIQIMSADYRLRPEAIESVFVLYRVTGDEYWREKGWEMFEKIIASTRSTYGATAIQDVMTPGGGVVDDSMESFWLAETLKYFYLLFSDTDTWSLDDYVLNTEAHPFPRPV